MYALALHNGLALAAEPPPPRAKSAARREIEQIYRAHAPAKLSDVGELCDKYGEGMLLERIREKYGPGGEPPPSADGGGGNGEGGSGGGGSGGGGSAVLVECARFFRSPAPLLQCLGSTMRTCSALLTHAAASKVREAPRLCRGPEGRRWPVS
jgi:hypothetical protein